MSGRRDDNPSELHDVHLLVLRLGPLVVIALGLLITIVGLFKIHSDPATVAMVTMGPITTVTGAVLPRVKGPIKLSHKGLQATLAAVKDFKARSDFVITGPALASDSGHHPTIGEVVEAAPSAGWTISSTTGAESVVLTRTISDSSLAEDEASVVSVVLPNKPEEQIAESLGTSLAAAGFELPSTRE